MGGRHTGLLHARIIVTEHMASDAPKMLTKKTIIFLELIVIVSLVFRFLLSSTEITYPDACTYLSISKSILNGTLFTDFLGGGDISFPPLYPLVTSAFYFITRNLE